MTKNNWDPYVQIGSEKMDEFLKSHFIQTNRKLLFILGVGFDIRMNIILRKLVSLLPNLNLEILLIEFDEGATSSSHRYKHLVNENVEELRAISGEKPVSIKRIRLIEEKKGKKKWIGDVQAADIIKDYSDLSPFSDIMVDISALPRSVYPSLVGKVLSLIEREGNTSQINFFVATSENAGIDNQIQESGAEDNLDYLKGFGGGIEKTSEEEKPIIWFPILGENKLSHLKKAYSHIIQLHDRPYEICPVLPFPSKNLRRADSLIIEYHAWLFDELGVESKDIIYVPEQNPFETYIRLNNSIKNYNDSLKTLGGCKAVISNFSSKLLSIGTILTGHELRSDIGVGILNVASEGYIINDESELKNLKNLSEVFLTWVTGEPYR
ncbi:MAG: hypothetical protein RI922_999 [Bacteroidota bacterium]|jgi:hypothetical protein